MIKSLSICLIQYIEYRLTGKVPWNECTGSIFILMVILLGHAYASLFYPFYHLHLCYTGCQITKLWCKYPYKNYMDKTLDYLLNFLYFVVLGDKQSWIVLKLRDFLCRSTTTVLKLRRFLRPSGVCILWRSIDRGAPKHVLCRPR